LKKQSLKMCMSRKVQCLEKFPQFMNEPLQGLFLLCQGSTLKIVPGV